jgi:hypothetical protein
MKRCGRHSTGMVVPAQYDWFWSEEAEALADMHSCWSRARVPRDCHPLEASLLVQAFSWPAQGLRLIKQLIVYLSPIYLLFSLRVDLSNMSLESRLTAPQDTAQHYAHYPSFPKILPHLTQTMYLQEKLLAPHSMLCQAAPAISLPVLLYLSLAPLTINNILRVLILLSVYSHLRPTNSLILHRITSHCAHPLIPTFYRFLRFTDYKAGMEAK